MSILFVINTFLSAGVFVKVFWVSLCCVMVISWVMMIRGVFSFYGLRKRMHTFEQHFWSGKSLDDLYDELMGCSRGPMEEIFFSGMHEWRYAVNRGFPVSEMRLRRIMYAMETVIQQQGRGRKKVLFFWNFIGYCVLVLSIFFGLWHLVDSVVVAQLVMGSVLIPAILEILLTIVLGLLTAIPMLLAYKVFAYWSGQEQERLHIFCREFYNTLSRYVERCLVEDTLTEKSEYLGVEDRMASP